jgi:hypothetical protein
VTQYNPKNPAHEMIALQWFLLLKGKPQEFADLFARDLQSLTRFLYWMANNVALGWECDERGAWACAWVEPMLTGAFFGGWIREDKRGTVGAVMFIRKAYRQAFEKFPVIIGITKQPALHDLHIALGYDYLGTVPKLFDNADARVYVLTKENFYGRRRKDKQRKPREQQPVLTGIDVGVSSGGADAAGAVSADDGSLANGGSQRANPVRGGERRKRKGSIQQQPAGAQESIGSIGSGG